MGLIQNILAVIVVLGLLITFHEFGHFWVARRCGVKVLRFSVGFGRPLWSRGATGRRARKTRTAIEVRSAGSRPRRASFLEGADRGAFRRSAQPFQPDDRNLPCGYSHTLRRRPV